MYASKSVSAAGIIALAILSAGAFFVSAQFAFAAENPTTDTASPFTSTTATLNATNGTFVADLGGEAIWYGPTLAGPFVSAADPSSQIPLGWTTGFATTINEVASAAFSRAIAGLSANTTFYFAAWSQVGGIWYPGSVESFTTLATHTLVYAAGAHGSLTGSASQTVDHGTSGTAVTANADVGYEFVNWSDASTANPRTDDGLSSVNVLANFVALSDIYVDPAGNDANDGFSAGAAHAVLTINHAVAIVPDGGTIHLSAGTYDIGATSITVNKSITFVGPNEAISPNGGSRVAEAIIQGNAVSATFNIPTVVTVAFKGLQFETVGAAMHSDAAGATITLEKNYFTSIATAVDSNYFADPNLTVNDNLFSNIALTGTTGETIQMGVPGVARVGSISITNNTWTNITGNGALNSSGQTGTVSGNTFNGVEYYGILVASDGTHATNLTITHNTFNNITNPTVAPTGNELTWGAGVRFYQATSTTAASVAWNTFSNSYLGVSVRSSDSDITGAAISVDHNAFTGNTNGILNAALGTLSAGSNWWNSTAGPNATTTSSVNTTGAGDSIVVSGGGDVTYRPWCQNIGCSPVDIVAPTVSNVSVTPNPAKAGPVTVTVTFSETMSNIVSPVVNIIGLTGSPIAVMQTSYTGNTWVGTATIAANNEDLIATTTVSASEDPSGNQQVGTDSAHTFHVDTVPPVVTSVSYNPTIGTLAIGDELTLTIHADAAGYTAGAITVNGDAVTNFADAGAGTYTAKYTVVSGNTDIATTAQIPVSVVLTDAASNSNMAFTTAPSAGATPGIDANAPLAPTIPDMTAGTDSGSSSTDNLTNITTPTFTGTAEVGSTVKLYDGATQIGSYLASGGTWSITSTTLTEGAHSIAATATDAVGNTSATSSPLSVTIDTTVPTVGTPDLDTASDSGTSSTDNLTASSTPLFTGTAEANSTVKIYDGAILVGSGTATGLGAWSISASTLSSGAHSIAAIATDASGNMSATSSALSITIDTTAPTLTQDTAVHTPTNDTTPDYAFATNEAATISYTGDCSSITTAAAVGTTTVTFSALSEAVHSNCAIKVTDAAGNQSAALNVPSFTIDITSPTVALTSAVGVLTNVPFSVTATFSEPTSDFSLSDISFTNATAGSFATTSSSVYTFMVNPTADGAVTATVNAGATHDAAPNPNTAGNTVSTTYDHTAPTLTVVSIASSNASTTLAKPLDTVTVSFTASEAISTPTVTIDGHAATVSGSGPYTAVYVLQSTDATGPVTFSINFADLATNAGTPVTATTNSSAVTFDKTVPTVVVTSSDVDGIVNTGTPVTFTATYSEPVQNSPIPSIMISGADTLPATAMTMTDSTHYTYLYTAGIGTGTTTFTVSGAVDLAGNTQAAGTASLTLDNTAPVITISGSNPDNVVAANTLYADAGATALDANDGVVAVVATNGVNLMIAGSYTVVYTATDAAGNTSTSSRTVVVTPGGNGPVSGGGGGGNGNSVVTALANNGGSAPAAGTSPSGSVLGASTYQFTQNLTIGSHGTDVTELQKVLIAGGFLKIPTPTGYFGQATRAAVQAYQAAHGITPVSGYVGVKTRAALNQGSTPTQSDEDRSAAAAKLNLQLQALLAQLKALGH
jgi:hypothetical protein